MRVPPLKSWQPHALITSKWCDRNLYANITATRVDNMPPAIREEKSISCLDVRHDGLCVCEQWEALEVDTVDIYRREAKPGSRPQPLV